ncbi:MAG: hypothetical protein RIM80_25690, partial [Alphaproteobacteria bacterium]
ALIPLTIWFCVSVIAMTGAEYPAVVAWIASPVVAGLLVLLIAAVFYHAVLTILTLVAGFHHAQLGLQVVIEDYIHGHAAKIGALWLVKGAAFFFGAAAVFSVLKLAIGG